MTLKAPTRIAASLAEGEEQAQRQGQAYDEAQVPGRAMPALRWALRVSLTALSYWVAGRLALLMAIPPGYATAVWPGAGLALVCVLYWGLRVAPGIALGSFLVNVGTAFDTSGTTAMLKSLGVALGISCGAACEATLGALLIRRFVGFPSALEEENDIAKFTLLGGPVSCLVSPTIGVGTLCGFEVVPWSNAAFSWWTWWVGDAIGVLIFAPLLLLWIPGAPVWRRRRLIIGTPLAIGFAVVTTLFLRVSAWEETRLRTDFERRATPLAHAFEARLAEYREIMGLLTSFFDASRDVSREEFREFCQRTLRDHTGIQGLGWNPSVEAGDRARFEAAVRAQGRPTFGIREFGREGELRPAGARAEYVPILYLEPEHPNRSALGFDIASDAVRLDALNRARASGDLSATSHLRLVAQPSDQSGVLLIGAVFDRSAEALPAAGLRRVRGYVVGYFRISSVVESALRGLEHQGLDFSVLDESAPKQSRLLHATGKASSHVFANASTARRWRETFVFGGRPWTVEVAATSAHMTAHRGWQAWMVLAAGLLFVGILGVVLLMATGQAARMQWALVERSAEATRATQAEEKLQNLNIQLEARVTGRTAELSKALKEREVLIQEIHHRVKNNLQVISSIINMQLRKLEAGANRDALEECQTRVQAIALIHEKLYQSKDYSLVPFSEYARSLASNVFHATGVSPASVSLELAIADLALAVDRAIPCGLVLNELITNALKHAFKDGRQGTIRVELSKLDQGRLRLTVKDDGVGLPRGFEIRTASSLGLQLICTLAEQLEADLEVDSRGGGTSFQLTFPAEV